MKSFTKILLATAACLTAGLTAYAAINLDDTGKGFVGKGDVQLMFLWNNHQLQACADSAPENPATDAGCLRFEFDLVRTTTTEVSWVCTNTNNDNVQERQRTTTTGITTGGISASVARRNKQVTGFNLDGGLEPAPGSGSTSEGPPLNSCPSGPWVLTTPAGDPEIVEEIATTTLTITDTRDGTTVVVEID